MRERLSQVEAELDFEPNLSAPLGMQLDQALAYAGLPVRTTNATIAWKIAALEAHVFSLPTTEDESIAEAVSAALRKNKTVHERVQQMEVELATGSDHGSIGKHMAKLAHTLAIDLHNHTMHEKLALLEAAIGSNS